MKTALVLILALLPAPLFAQSAFELMVGSWRGEGKYAEGITEVKLRCRVTIAGDATAVHMEGRCASSLGSDDFTMDFVRGPNGTARVQQGQSNRGADSSIDSLSGPIGRNGMVLTGSSEDEEVVVQLLLNDDGTLAFATREISQGNKSVSYVTLSRQ